MNQTARDITLRTFSGDVSAVSKNQRPQPETISMGLSHANPVSSDQQETNKSQDQSTPKKSHAVLIVGIVVLLALGGYFAYLLLS
jgi:hypothetical protein